ncbi:AAA-like domain-containing protein [Pseudanabaena yagii]|uniref:non-specific serine/threonine protein kinase n=1 Tax=Pseudanabaena yagii GIHE-NHR1 TaxID=2722753 RepID=A0ABX1LQ90_9CYAN|nr:AAA-like domain-containing protein [Pseudanabaena yagii]NMF58283.1 protein kinase [Pseudanabaena yagii GIHE-NHR1]
MTNNESVLAGRYEIISPLGGGGFGQTFLAKDNQLPDFPLCVVKQLKPKFASPQDLEIAKRLFDREAKTLHYLGNHDQIPRLFAHLEQNGEFYLVQELVDGHTLDHEIIDEQPWSQDEVLIFLQDILQVLAFVHRSQVIHRDIKPANLMRRNSDRKIILIDFGAVKALGTKTTPQGSDAQTTSQTLVIGSLGYMPCEQIAGHPQFSSDIYAVGMVCIQALTGIKDCLKIPKDRDTNELVWQNLVDSISPKLISLLDKMVRYDYRQRYEDGASALDALSNLLSNSNKTTILRNSDLQHHLEEPDGQVATNSIFYVNRPPVEQDCYEAIEKNGALIRIKAPRQMGKSSLMCKILHYANQKGCQAVSLNFQSADSSVFADLDKFLRWFCANVGRQLKLKTKISDSWDDIFGSKDNCTAYFEDFVLPNIDGALALSLDEVDLIFQYRVIAEDFFGLLRAWHEAAKSDDLWKRLRLIVVHSQEVYIPLNINQSPFNVGLPIELREFSQAQVSDLVDRHRLDWTDAQIEKLMAMLGGHPYLVRVALYYIARNSANLDYMLSTAPTEAGIYSDHLRRHLWNLEQNPKLAKAMKKVVSSSAPVRLPSEETFKLDSMGLTLRQGNDVIPRCNLYQIYFSDRLEVGDHL